MRLKTFTATLVNGRKIDVESDGELCFSVKPNLRIPELYNGDFFGIWDENFAPVFFRYDELNTQMHNAGYAILKLGEKT